MKKFKDNPVKTGHTTTLQAIQAKIAAKAAKDTTAWKAELRRLKLAYLKRTAPGFYDASGGDTMKIGKFSDKTANGLTNCVMDWLKFSGHYCNRVNVQGQARIHRIPRFSLSTGKVEHIPTVRYTKSTTRRGTADIDAIVNGTPVKIEIKIGKDIQSDAQKAEQKRVEAAGGIYLLVANMCQFVQWYRNYTQTIQ